MNINKIRMYKDPNGKWDMELHTNEAPHIIKEEIAYIDGSHYHYGENSDGIVCFGVSNDTPSLGHEAGYMWSSRCGVFNTAFGKRLIDITLCVPNEYGSISRYGYYYMTVDKALELLPDGFHISLFQYDDGEEFYEFIRYDESEEELIADYSGKFICPIFA